MTSKILQLRCGCRTIAAVAVLLTACLWTASAAQAQTISSDGKHTLLTVPVEGGLDAIFFYDDVTRVLKGSVPNAEGAFSIVYKPVSIDKLFAGPGGKTIKDPKFLFAVGRVSIRTRGRLQFGSGMIYITETKTGRMVALALPWSKSFRTQRKPLNLEPVRIQQFRLRNVDMDE